MSSDPLWIRMKSVESVKVLERACRIDQLVAAAISRGEDPDRLFWTIVHDLEHAPPTTNLDQLEDLGFTLPSLGEIQEMDSAELQTQLSVVLDAMSVIRVFICGADHLSTRSLLEHLIRVVVQESVPDLPHSLGSRQWVDLSAVSDG